MKLIFIAFLILLLVSMACGGGQDTTPSHTTSPEPVKTIETTPEHTPTPELFTTSEFGKSSYIGGLGGIDSALLGSPSWMTFTDAKEFIKKVGLNSEPEFHEWASTDKRPTDFPLRPPALYTDEWTDWADFLGISN